MVIAYFLLKRWQVASHVINSKLPLLIQMHVGLYYHCYSFVNSKHHEPVPQFPLVHP